MIWVARFVLAASIPFVILLGWLSTNIIVNYGLCPGFYILSGVTVALAVILVALALWCNRLAKIAERIEPDARTPKNHV